MHRRHVVGHTTSQVTFIVVFVILLPATLGVGCKETSSDRDNSVPAATSKSEKAVTVTRSAVGPIQIGMTAEQAKMHLSNPKSVTFPGPDSPTYLESYADGIDVLLENGRVTGIFAYYRSKQHRRCSGKTKEGIDVNSTVRDVICTYGQPAVIFRSHREESDQSRSGVSVDLAYLDGYSFQFLDDKLERITVSAPRNLKPEEVPSDVGDTKAYRDIECE